MMSFALAAYFLVGIITLIGLSHFTYLDEDDAVALVGGFAIILVRPVVYALLVILGVPYLVLVAAKLLGIKS